MDYPISESSYKFHPQLILRTPALSYLSIQDAEISNTAFYAIISDEQFMEAIYLASPTLYYQSAKLRDNKIGNPFLTQKIFLSLYKYYCRMRTRCTPFGLFAGCSVISWGDQSQVTVKALERHNRFDMTFQCALAKYISQNETLRFKINYFTNNSVFFYENEIRYFEYQHENKGRRYQISTLPISSHLTKILDHTKSGARIETLHKILIDSGATSEESINYVNALIDSQVIVSELEPAITDVHNMSSLISRVEKINLENECKEISRITIQIRLALKKINDLAKNSSNNVKKYLEIISLLKETKAPIEESTLFQTDLFRKTTEDSSLDSSIKEKLLNALKLLDKITPKKTRNPIAQFVQEYEALYGDLEMPLLKVLDPELGIPYGKRVVRENPLIDGLDFSAITRTNDTITVDRTTKILTQKLIEFNQRKYNILQISDVDFSDTENQSKTLPSTLSVVFTVIDSNTNKLYLRNCGGPSAVNPISRFADCDDSIRKIAGELAQSENNSYPNSIVAEIVHIPDDRIGNVLIHPVLRDYEIPISSRSAVRDSHQIKLQDLYIKIYDGKFILRSKKLNAIIIPRMSTAYNFNLDCHPILRFLCDLQTQGLDKQDLSFDWGTLAFLFKHTPRVEFENVILDVETWHLEYRDFELLINASNEEISHKIVLWRETWRLPEMVYFSDGDNDLLINFNDSLSINVFLGLIRKRNNIKLCEALFLDTNSVVRDDKNHPYTNEFIAFLHQESTNKIQEYHPNENNSPNINPKISIGDNWFSYHLYCSPVVADKLLIEVIHPLVNKMLFDNTISGWFFIRYYDPDFHLRIRLKPCDTDNISTIIDEVLKGCRKGLSVRVISKISIQTYIRELERYPWIEESERLFEIDSRATIEALAIIRKYGDANLKWLYVLKGIDSLFSAFSFDMTKKQRLIQFLFDGFFKEHNGDKALKKHLNQRYGNLKYLIFHFFDLNTTSAGGTSMLRLLRTKEKEVSEVVMEINSFEKKDNDSTRIEMMVSSYIHMMCNRAFENQPRTNELVIYHLLNKYYTSQLARRKNQSL